MALLFFENLGASRPEIALGKTYNGLQDFFHYLKRAKEHFEQTRPTLPWRLAGVKVVVARPSGGLAMSEARWQQRLDAVLLPHRANGDELRLTLELPERRGGSVALDIWGFDSESRILVLENTLERFSKAWLGTRQAPQQLEVTLEKASSDATARGLQGVWIEFLDAAGKESEKSILEAFLDEDLNDVYEVPPEKSGNGAESDPALADASEADDAPRRRSRRHQYLDQNKINIIDRRPEDQVLCLWRAPQFPTVCVRPNTHVIDRQMDAVQALMNRPDRAHLPLVNLFQRIDVPRWPPVNRSPIAAWNALTKPEYPGTSEQRDFVERALGTEDFMLMEGPPGSGKTTAIIELILQLIAQGKRVLLTASTHVAVDNVLKDLKDATKPWCDKVLMCRIGDEKKVRSERVRPYCLNRLVDTEHRRLIEALESMPARSASQQVMLRALKSNSGRELVRNLLLDTVQIVAGTTIGILQHPALRGNRERGIFAQPQFDVMILDEASKTPFAEFLVPALLARRWIIVGDRRQLSPYIEESWVTTNLDATMSEEGLSRVKLTKGMLGQTCLDLFDCVTHPKQRALVVASSHPPLRAAYIRQASARLPPGLTVDLADEQKSSSPWLALAQVVVGSPEAVQEAQQRLPLDVGILRTPPGTAMVLRRRHAASPDGKARFTGSESKTRLRHKDEERTWSSELAWRLIREYELRMLPELMDGERGAKPHERLANERQLLLPAQDILPESERTITSILEGVEALRRVALPSILESLQQGFGPAFRQKVDSALARGLPPSALTQRLVSLTYQHRMHPDISAFPRSYIYQGQALRDSTDMVGRRMWGYERDRPRARFLHVDSEEQGSPPGNPGEVDEMMVQLSQFIGWARSNPAPTEEGVWTVAVLTYYREQERLLRTQLRRLTGQGHKVEFSLSERGREYVRVHLGTVDSFQGYEADLVLLSMVRTRAEGFLNSPNRLNVALTRARYQLLVVGNRQFFLGQDKKRGRVSLLLQRLATSIPFDITLGRKEQH